MHPLHQFYSIFLHHSSPISLDLLMMAAKSEVALMYLPLRAQGRLCLAVPAFRCLLLLKPTGLPVSRWYRNCHGLIAKYTGSGAFTVQLPHN